MTIIIWRYFCFMIFAKIRFGFFTASIIAWDDGSLLCARGGMAMLSDQCLRAFLTFLMRKQSICILRLSPYIFHWWLFFAPFELFKRIQIRCGMIANETTIYQISNVCVVGFFVFFFCSFFFLLNKHFYYWEIIS